MTSEVTAQKVRAVLKKAGFRNAEMVRSGQILGFGYWTRGFKVRTVNTILRVEAKGRPHDPISDDARRYAEALIAAGIGVEIAVSTNIIYITGWLPRKAASGA